MSAAARLALGVLAASALALTPGRAAADPVEDAERAVRNAQELVDRARDLARTATEVRDFLYYLSDPRGFQYDLYATQDLILKDPVLGPLARNLASLYAGRVWTFTAQAQAMGDTATPASAAVGASIAWDAPLCRLFEAQASGQVFYEDDGPAAAMAWGVGGCLPLPFDTFELGYRGRRSVRTSLLAIPIVSGDRQSGDTVYSNLRFYRWLSANHQIDVMPMSFNFDWANQAGTTSFQSWASLGPVHWARRGKGYGGRDQTYDFARVAFTTLGLYDQTYDPLVVTISPLAIDGIRLGDHVAIGLDLGWNLGELYDGQEVAGRPKALYFDASVIGGAERATVEVHLRNAMQPTIEYQLLDEDRLTARLDANRDAGWLRVDGFVSHARLIGLDRASQKVWTYGAGADVTLALTEHVFGYARAEAARGIVVDRVRELPATALALRGTIGVTTQLQSTW